MASHFRARYFLIAIIALSMMGIAVGEISVSICTKKPEGAYVSAPNATVYGMQSMRAFGSGWEPFMGASDESPWLAAMTTGLVVVFLSVAAWIKAPPNAPMAYYIIATYPLSTAIVEFARVIFDASRFGFITASWHNVFEWQILLFLFNDKETAEKHWRTVLGLIWILNVWQLFVPSLDGVLSGLFWAGFPEQITGICADWLLIVTMGYLWLGSTGKFSWIKTPVDHELHTMYKYGFLGAVFHMLEIGPLVALLSGLTARPSFFIGVIVALTTPFTFWFYSIEFGWRWGHEQKHHTDSKKPIDARDRKRIIAICIVCGLITILAPPNIFPECATGQPTPTGKPELSALGTGATPKSYFATPEETAAALAAQQQASLRPSQTICPNPAPAPTPAPTPPPVAPVAPPTVAPIYTRPVTPATGASSVAAGSSQLFCPSTQTLTGFTTVRAKTGKGEELLDMVSTMQYPVLKEEGAISYQISYNQKDETIKFIETWSTIRTMLKHIYMSPAVRKVFYSKQFSQLKRTQLLEGPFPTMLPCSEVAKETKPIHLVFSVPMKMDMHTIWESLSDWGSDVSWVKGALGVTPLSDDLRIIHFKTINLTEIRQPAPLPAVDQPANGHRLAYYLLDGGFVSSLLDVYRGEVTLQQADPSSPRSTLFTYRITAVPKATTDPDQAYQILTSQFDDAWVQFMQNWAVGLRPYDDPNTREYFFQFALNNTNFPNAQAALTALIGNAPGTLPIIRYAALIPVSTDYGTTSGAIKEPDMSKGYNFAMALRFPVGSISPDLVGAGIATAVWKIKVKSRYAIQASEITACNDTVVDAHRAAAKPLIDNAMAVFARVQAALTSDNPPIDVSAKESGININKYHPGYGMACYHKYLYVIDPYLRKTRSVTAYHATVVKDPSIPDEAQWDEIVIPVYPNRLEMLSISTDPQYPEMLYVRFASLSDSLRYLLSGPISGSKTAYT